MFAKGQNASGCIFETVVDVLAICLELVVWDSIVSVLFASFFCFLPLVAKKWMALSILILFTFKASVSPSVPSLTVSHTQMDSIPIITIHNSFPSVFLSQ